MLRRFLKALHQKRECNFHELTISPVCIKCGFNITKPIVFGKDRSKSKRKRK